MKNEEKNIFLLKSQVDGVNTSFEGCKNALREQQKISKEMEIELIKFTIENNTLKVKLENTDHLGKDNGKLKSKIILFKIENLELNNTVKSLTAEVAHRDESIVRLTHDNEEGMRLLVDARKEVNDVNQYNTSLKLLNIQNRESSEEANKLLITVKSNQYEGEIDTLKNTIQQDLIKSEHETQRIIWELKQNHDKEINNNEMIKTNEINEIKKNYELQINTIKNTNKKDFEDLQRVTDKEMSSKESNNEIRIQNMQENFHRIFENEKIEKDFELKKMEENFSSLKIENEQLLISEKMKNERDLQSITDKYNNCEEKLQIVLRERERQVEITTQYCDEKLTHECQDLLRIQENIEQQLIHTQKEVISNQFINNELIKVFISCCDAMCEWEEELSGIVEGETPPPLGSNRRTLDQNSILPSASQIADSFNNRSAGPPGNDTL